MLSKARFDLLLGEQKKANFLYFKSASEWINEGTGLRKSFLGVQAKSGIER